MITYPVRISVDSYRGKDQGRQFEFQQKAQVAAKIQTYLNEQMENRPTRTFSYFDIAQDLQIDQDMVRAILYRVDGGSGGITVANPNVKDDE